MANMDILNKDILRAIRERYEALRGDKVAERATQRRGVMGKETTRNMREALQSTADDALEAMAYVAEKSVSSRTKPEDMSVDEFDEATKASADEAVQLREDMGITESLKGDSYEGMGLMAKPGADGVQPTGGKGLESKIRDRLIGLESFRGEAYKPVDTEEYYTIGYGHYGKQVKKGSTISEEEARKLLDKDIKERLSTIRKRLPNYDKLSEDLQVEIAQGWFRGDISGSPDTLKLIKKGMFAEAADEFLDNDEYRNAEELGKPGIKRRMEAIANALRAEANG